MNTPYVLFLIAFILMGIYAFFLSRRCDRWEATAHHWKAKHDKVQEAAAVIANWLQKEHLGVFNELSKL